MKILLTIFIASGITFFSCTTNNKSDEENRGAQSSMDHPSNLDRDVDPHKHDSVHVKEHNRGTTYDSISEAPNATDSNSTQGIQGQTGNNQTGGGQ